MTLSATRDLFDRWEQVWHDGCYDLIPGCLGLIYLRHDDLGDRSMPREDYAAELQSVHATRPGIRVAVYEHALAPERAWFRFAFAWNDPDTGARQSRAGLQLYRIEGGLIAETWVVLRPPGSPWPDRQAQERWTSPLAR